MPTLEHGALIDMFRKNPALVADFLEHILHVTVPPYASIRVVDTNLDQLVPIEFRADLVIELCDESGELLLTIIIEVQRAPDLDKLYTWPVYATVQRARRRCRASVLVVAPDVDVATWASQVIDIGPGFGGFTPLVLGPVQIPAITDPERARREPELAVLSARTHGNDPNGPDVVLAMLTALEQFDSETAGVYLSMVYDSLREPVRKILEALIMERQQQGALNLPPFVYRVRQEGEAEGMRKVLLKLIARACIALSDEERARIEACDDPALLDRWSDNALTAQTAAELFR